MPNEHVRDPECVPPQNIDAEQATLGSMMLDRLAIRVASDIVREGDFYRPTHGIIFDAMCAVDARDEPVDLITLKDELITRGRLEEIGGVEYLMALISQVPSASRVEHYAKIVEEKSLLRRIISCGAQVTGLGYAETDRDEAIARATQIILGLSETARLDGFRHVRDIVTGVWEAVREAKTTGSDIAGLRTGVPGLDRITWGLPAGLTLIAGRPSTGKTSLLLQIMTRNPGPFAFFSFETTGEALVRRIIAAGADVEVAQLRTGNLSEDEFDRVLRAVNDVYQLDIYISDRSCDIGRLIAMAKRAVLQYGVQAIIVDYLQLVRPGASSRRENREQEVASVTRGLKGLAQDLQIPVVAASQLKRPERGKEDQEPTLVELRESGEQEAAADVVVLIHNPKPPGAEDDGSPRSAKLIVAKQRDGRTARCPCMWRGAWLRFYEASDREEESE